MEKVGTNTATVSWERNGVMPDKYVLVQRNEYSESKIIIEGDQTTDEKKERVFSRVSRVYLSNDKDQKIYQFVAFLAKKQIRLQFLVSLFG